MVNKKQVEKQRVVLSKAFNDYNKRLNSYAFFKINNHATGEDLVQKTFLKTWLYLVKNGKVDTMKAFLYHILNDLIVDEYRKHKTISLDLLLEKGFEPSTNNFERLFNQIDGKPLFLLIKQLPKKYQDVMLMRYKQDLSIKEISIVTGQSRNTVAVQAYRGLEKLKLLYNLR